MNDLIDRQAALDALRSRQTYLFDSKDPDKKIELRSAEMAIEELPTVHPNHTADISKKVSISCGHENDLIFRQAAIDALFKLYEYQRDIDPTEAADLVRQGVYLAEKKIEQLPSTQPDHNADIGKKAEGDCISRQAAIDALAKQMPRSYTPDGSHPADEEIFRAQEIFADCIEALEILPSAQPATNCSEIPNGSDDTISRRAAVDALDEQIEQCNKALCSFYISPKDEYAIKVERASLKAYKEQLENMPSVQPEQNEKWIYNSPTTMKCDRCGFAIKDWDWHRFKYCPNCGADMRKENES